LDRAVVRALTYCDSLLRRRTWERGGIPQISTPLPETEFKD
jgi:hypothetical protein